MSKATTTTRFRLDPKNLPTLTPAQQRRLATTKPDLTDIPELPADFWQRNKPAEATPNKAPVTLRLDPDILDYFKRGGRRYQTRINAVLRAFVDAQRRPASRKKA